ncbi:C40 family peptidase [Budvicia diplopodorum]|uniref:C40 family peptidase n=1 Tax=Budvicia diplopodorum TaxID=1119056 RepID=UPI001FE74C7C|nr:C40 family peptidase [Budvicia diplopodorum]
MMLFFSFHAHATNSHKTAKKPPVVTHSVAKTATKRKRTSQKSASNAHSHSARQSHTGEEAYEIPEGSNPFAQNNSQSLQISDGMHPKMTVVQSTKITTAKRQVIAKLMKQLGKPYRYGGSSPLTGFDCSGLVKYAYNDQLKTTLPRTADNMFSMSQEQALKVKKEELHSGDLVFFRTNRSRTHAGHVGVYLGDGEFIQAPRTGEEIQISRLDDNYWQEHYIGARRVLLPSAVR